MKSLNGLDWTALILVLAGAINWGFIGFFDYNLVLAIFGDTASRVVYALVGLSAIYIAAISPSLVHRMQPQVRRHAPQQM